MINVRADSFVRAPQNAHGVGAELTPTIPKWKRPVDLGLGVAAVVLLSPLMIVTALLIRLTSRGPILFKQERVGRGERVFTMLKFRTMRNGSGERAADRSVIAEELAGSAKPSPTTGLYRPSGDPRVTRIGRLLRRLSIDELPQLLNVIAGQMSLVGPRPAPPDEVMLFTAEQRRRHACLPGITGLWQVGGRNRVDSKVMLALDLDYVERCSLSLDLSILVRTPRAVLFDRYTR